MKISEFFKKIFTGGGKLKTVIIIVVLVFLVVSAMLNWFQDKWNTNLKGQNIELVKSKKQLDKTIKNLTEINNQAQGEISKLEYRYDSLKKSYMLREAEMIIKEDIYKKEILKLKTIPPDQVYKDLITIYQDSINELKFRFTKNQVREFYTTYKSYVYQLDLNTDFEKQLNTLDLSLQSSEEIIKNKNIQIGSLTTKYAATNSYLARVEERNSGLEKSYKSERLSKNIWQGISALEFLVILYKGFEK